MENDIVCHEIVRIPSYRSNIFSTQIFQELLELIATVNEPEDCANRVEYLPLG
jgi:hypothetical protein